MSVTTKIILDTRRIKKTTGTYPVKLRVTFNRISQNYQTVHDLTRDEFALVWKPGRDVNMLLLRDTFEKIVLSAKRVIKDLKIFSFQEFEEYLIKYNPLFRPKKSKDDLERDDPDYFDYAPYFSRFPLFKEDHSKRGCISAAFLAYIKKLIREERIGTALNYQSTYTSLKNFKGNIKFTDISVTFLYQYEKWMLGKNRTKGTVGIKLRPLRAIFNEVIEQGLIKREKCYPFGKRRYQIPSSRNVKKAINIDKIGEIYNYQTENKDELKARDLWMFCYFGNGMNAKDMANLKFKNIEGEYIVFLRAKTERATRHDPRPITVYLTDDMLGYIEKWGNEDKNPNNYIFPILRPGLSALEQHYECRSLVKYINTHVRKIGIALGLERRLTTIVSRHSFSTQLKRSGASTEFIQESLGHTDKKTTENYLDSFENETKKEFAKKLSAFKFKKKALSKPKRQGI